MKTAIITGSEGMLGKAYVKRLLEMDYRVIGFDVLPETEDSSIEYFKVDITSQREISAAVEQIEGIVDLLINNAGVSVFSPFEDRTGEEIDFVMGVNIKGTILMTQSIFNRFFKSQKSGCIVNVGSIYGVVAGDMRIYRAGDRRTPEIYGATKAAIINITKYFAAYMAPHNIRVNCISPGGIFNHQDEDFVDKYANKVPQGRMGQDTELLSTLEYLISDASSYVNGQNVVVDGGLTAW